MMIEYRIFDPTDETDWLRCRVIAFLDSPYYENVITEKPKYETGSVELVAYRGAEILGFMDTQFESSKETLCYGSGDIGAVIWELGILPENRREGMASQLLDMTLAACVSRKLRRIQAWTRADPKTCGYYEKHGFLSVYRYWHVWLRGTQLRSLIKEPIPELTPVNAYCEYTGTDIEGITPLAERIEECICYERRIS